MWETVDPDGRRVVLSFDRWRHIVEEHGELEPYRRSLLAAISAPDRRIPGRWTDEEWFYLRTAHPSRWIKVAVHFEDGEGRIVTAFPRRRFP